MESPNTSSPDPAESPGSNDTAFSHSSTRQQMTDAIGEAHHIMRFDDVRTFAINGQAVRFTPLEYRLVQLLIDHLGRLVTYDELTQAAFGSPDSSASRGALEKHLDRIRSKVRTIGLDLPGVTNYGCLLIWRSVRYLSQ